MRDDIHGGCIGDSSDGPPAAPEPVQAPETGDEWMYGDGPAGLRMRAAEELAAEFGTDVSEWLV